MRFLILTFGVLALVAAEALAGDCHARAQAAAAGCGGQAVVLAAKGRPAPGVVANSQARRAGRHAQRAATLAVKAASVPVAVAAAPVVVAQAAPCVAAVAVAPVVLAVQPRARRVRGLAVVSGACGACQTGEGNASGGSVSGPLSNGGGGAGGGNASASANTTGGGSAKAEANSQAAIPLEPLPGPQ